MDPSHQWDVVKLPKQRSPWLHDVELQHTQAQQILQETGRFLTLQLVEAVLILPLGVVLCLSASHR